MTPNWVLLAPLGGIVLAVVTVVIAQTTSDLRWLAGSVLVTVICCAALAMVAQSQSDALSAGILLLFVVVWAVWGLSTAAGNGVSMWNSKAGRTGAPVWLPKVVGLLLPVAVSVGFIAMAAMPPAEGLAEPSSGAEASP